MMPGFLIKTNPNKIYLVKGVLLNSINNWGLEPAIFELLQQFIPLGSIHFQKTNKTIIPVQLLHATPSKVSKNTLNFCYLTSSNNKKRLISIPRLDTDAIAF